MWVLPLVIFALKVTSAMATTLANESSVRVATLHPVERLSDELREMVRRQGNSGVLTAPRAADLSETLPNSPY